MWHAELLDGGILKVRIDRRDKSANALSKGMLEELERLIAEIRRDAAVHGVMFLSGKPGSFIVGADVTEMKSMSGGAEAAELSKLGQRVFELLETLHVPTVALISGACLGGGLEFAMSCRYRVADDHAKTLLGLPEVKLGLIPGWGGTVRLPKLVGLVEALPMILTGRLLSGWQARSKGLVHDMVPVEALPLVGGLVAKRDQSGNRQCAFQAAETFADRSADGVDSAAAQLRVRQSRRQSEARDQGQLSGSARGHRSVAVRVWAATVDRFRGRIGSDWKTCRRSSHSRMLAIVLPPRGCEETRGTGGHRHPTDQQRGGSRRRGRWALASRC